VKDLETQLQRERKNEVELVRKRISDAIDDSINYFVSNIQFEKHDSETHSTIVVAGWRKDNVALQHVAKYLVGLKAHAIDAALNVRADLIGEIAIRKRFILNEVLKLVGESNNRLTKKKKSDERNPWICEGLWHLCMAVARLKPELHPPGYIFALNYVHVNAKDHGLDGLAIYESDDRLGLSIIESKAYKLDPSTALQRATFFFKDVDEDKYAGDIFDKVQIIRTALPSELQSQISDMFWEQERAYIPNPHYDGSVTEDWFKKREVFKNLDVNKENIIIMPNIIDDFDGFFDDIADMMREFAGGL
jgi:hypothetical protein